MNDIDDLMSADPMSLSDADIDKIILAQRRHRAMVESGVKVKRTTTAKAPLSGTMAGLLNLVTTAPAAKPKASPKPPSGGIRR